LWNKNIDPESEEKTENLTVFFSHVLLITCYRPSLIPIFSQMSRESSGKQLDCLFALSGSAHLKAALSTLMKLSPVVLNFFSWRHTRNKKIISRHTYIYKFLKNTQKKSLLCKFYIKAFKILYKINHKKKLAAHLEEI